VLPISLITSSGQVVHCHQLGVLAAGQLLDLPATVHGYRHRRRAGLPLHYPSPASRRLPVHQLVQIVGALPAFGFEPLKRL